MTTPCHVSANATSAITPGPHLKSASQKPLGTTASHLYTPSPIGMSNGLSSMPSKTRSTPLSLRKSFVWVKFAQGKFCNAGKGQFPSPNTGGAGVTKAVTTQRINMVYGLLVDGKSRADVVQFCADNFDINTRQADNYIKKAREKLEKDCDISRQAFLAETLAGIRQIRNKAENRGQMQVALNALRLAAELTKLTDS